MNKFYSCLANAHNNGYYYGFPFCCIEDFVDRTSKSFFIYRIRKFDGLGFVPCKECNKLPRSKLVSYINKNREHDVPFYGHKIREKASHKYSARKLKRNINRRRINHE